MEKLIYFMIHCTATPEGRELTTMDIRRMHCSPRPAGNGWKQVGYSDMIHLDGRKSNLVPYDGDDVIQPREITNGALGLNGKTRHIVYVGGVDSRMKPKDTRTDLQKKALRTEVLKVLAAYPKILFLGHYQVDKNKACPCFDVPEWLRSIDVPEKNIYKL